MSLDLVVPAVLFMLMIGVAAIMAYSLALQIRAVRTQKEAVANHEQAMERVKRSLELQERNAMAVDEFVILQREANVLLRDILAHITEKR